MGNSLPTDNFCQNLSNFCQFCENLTNGLFDRAENIDLVHLRERLALSYKISYFGNHFGVLSIIHVRAVDLSDLAQV